MTRPAIAPEVVVIDVQEALGCRREDFLSDHGVDSLCSQHWDGYPEWSERGCPVAVIAADAAVHAFYSSREVNT